MLTATIYSYDVPANGSVRLPVIGAFFRILAASGAVTVQTDAVNLKGLGVGDGFEKTPYSWLTLTDTSGATNTVRFVVSDAAFLNAPQVSTTVTNAKTATSAAFANTQKTVTNVSAELAAGNTARQYLLIQNRDASGTIYLNFGAGAATAANGLKLAPGAFWEWDSTVSTQAVQAIGDIASNANVLIVEG